MADGTVAAMVVLYHPGAEVTANMASWAGQAAAVYAVDNTPGAGGDRAEALTGRDQVRYLPFGDNRGVACALNAGAAAALADGHDWLLTMDQDSAAEPGMVATMLDCLTRCGMAPVGMIAPYHVTGTGHTPPAEDCTPVMTPMTSGCLLNLAAYRDVGPFRDDFFIDFVDNEYCLRLRRAGYTVLRANRALLWHRVGDTKKYGPFIATHHGALRRYYKTRNRLWVFREYLTAFPGHCLFDLVRLAKEVASILLFEADKGAKLAMMGRGAADSLRGRFGRFDGTDTAHPDKGAR